MSPCRPAAGMPLPGETRRTTMNDKHPHMRAAALAALAAAAATATDSTPAEGLGLNDDTPLAPACDLSGDGTCEACQ